MIHETALRLAIEAAYRAFASVPCPTSWQAAPDRDGVALLKNLTAVPLPRLSADVIGPYAGWAIASVGSGADYRYFLPRILELAVCGPVWPGAEPSAIAQKLNAAGWSDWPDGERTAVTDLFCAAFRYTVRRHPEFTDEAPWWLCGLAHLHVSLAALLDEWRRAETFAPHLQLAHLVNEVQIDMARGRMLQAWWETAPQEVAIAFAHWLASADTKLQLAAWRDRAPSEDRWVFDNALLFWA